MKSTFIVMCFVLVAVTANPVQEKWNRVHQQCQSDPDLYVDDNIFEQLKKGGKPKLPENFSDHAKCMMVKLDLQGDDGHILRDGVQEAVRRVVSDPAKANQIVDECSKETSALGLFGCFGKHHINIGQF